MKRYQPFLRLSPTRKLAICTFALWGCVNSLFAVPYIFNATESATPGALFYVQGDNFVVNSINPTVWFHLVSGTESALTPDSQLDSSDIASVSNQAITANLPLNIPFGLYTVWVKDSAGVFSDPVFINRARSMSLEYGEVSAGYTFRIFGRNLALPGATPSVTFVNGTYSSPATVVTTYPNDGNVLQIQAPADLPTSGTFTLLVSNGYGHGSSNYDVTSSEQTILGRTGGPDVFNLGVPWSPNFAALASSTINVVTSINPHTSLPYGADPTGVNNSVNAIQQALYDAGNAIYYPNGAVVFLQSGTFLINHAGESTTFYGTSGSNTSITQSAYQQLVFPSRVVLMGSGTDQTVINDATDAMPYPNRGMCNVNKAGLFGLLNFTYMQSGTAVTTSGTNVNNGAPALLFGGSSTFASNLVLNFAYSAYPHAQGSTFAMGGGGSRNVLAQNIYIDHGLFQAAASVGTAYYINVRNNTMIRHGYWYRTRIEVGGVFNLVFENNHCTRDSQWPGADAYEQGGVDSGGSYGVYLNNIFDAINPPLHNGNDGETILFQGQPDQYDFGNPTAVSGTSITDSSKTWTANVFAGQSLAIVKGPGMGQWRTVVSNTDNTVYISQPWTENPTAASTYALTGGGGDRCLIKGNTITDQPRGVTLYCGSHDCAVVNNTLVDTGQSIYLRSDQRNTSTSGSTTSWYGRINPAWHNVVTDNICLNIKGTWSSTVSSALYQTSDSPLAGALALGNEFRRNVQQSILSGSNTNMRDSAIAINEGYSNLSVDSEKTYTETNTPGLLATIFDDNTAIKTNNVYQLNTEAYQTTIWNALRLSSTNLILSSTLTGGTHGAVNTSWGSDPYFVNANFSGTGTSTGGFVDLVEAGAAATLSAGTGQNSIAISSTNSFNVAGGPYLAITTGTTGTGACVRFAPTTARTSWGRIFDGRIIAPPCNGMWLVNGGFDFFWRPAQVPATANSMRPIDVGNNANGDGLQLTFYNSGASTLRHEIVTGPNGGGIVLSGTYGSGFSAGQIYHVGVTYSTSGTTGVTTAKMFAISGTGAIITSGSNAATPIATGTFTLNPGVVTNTNGFLGTDSWTFGENGYQNGTVRTNDYDCLRFYSQDPGVFGVCKQDVLPPLPVITSGTGATITQGQTYSYQITAANTATSYNATGLPSNLGVNTVSGLISGSVAVSGSFGVVLSATNASGAGTAAFALVILTPIATWQNSWFGANPSGSIAGDTVVNNKAGITNLMSYALGMNPYTATVSGLPYSGKTTVSGTNYLSLSFTRNSLATDVTYAVEGSGSLSGSNNWTPVSTFSSGAWSPSANVTETGSGSAINVQVNDVQPMSSTNRRFLRLKVTH